MPTPIDLLLDLEDKEQDPQLAKLIADAQGKLNELKTLRKQYSTVAGDLCPENVIASVEYYLVQGWKEGIVDLNFEKFYRTLNRCQNLLSEAHNKLPTLAYEKAKTTVENASSAGIYIDMTCEIYRLRAQRNIFPQFAKALSSSKEMKQATIDFNKSYKAYRDNPEDPSKCEDFNVACSYVKQLSENNSRVYNAISEEEKEASAKQFSAKQFIVRWNGDVIPVAEMKNKEKPNQLEQYKEAFDALSLLQDNHEKGLENESSHKIYAIIEMQIGLRIAYESNEIKLLELFHQESLELATEAKNAAKRAEKEAQVKARETSTGIRVSNMFTKPGENSQQPQGAHQPSTSSGSIP